MRVYVKTKTFPHVYIKRFIDAKTIETTNDKKRAIHFVDLVYAMDFLEKHDLIAGWMAVGE